MAEGGGDIDFGFAGVDSGGGPVLDETVGKETVRVLAKEDGLCVGGVGGRGRVCEWKGGRYIDKEEGCYLMVEKYVLSHEK